MKYFKYIFLAIILTSLGQGFIWTKGGDKVIIPPQISDKLESVSYTPFKGFEKALKSNEEIAQDIGTIVIPIEPGSKQSNICLTKYSS